MSPDNQRKGLKDAVEVLIKYLDHKVDERDWHAVSDAANDLRVLEARIIQIESCINPKIYVSRHAETTLS
jgi:hypothetical protein